MNALSQATGKDMDIQEVSIEEYKDLPQIKAYFGTKETLDTLDRAWEAIRAGEAAGVTSSLSEVLPSRCLCVLPSMPTQNQTPFCVQKLHPVLQV